MPESSQPDPNSTIDQRLADVLDRYLADQRNGTAPTREQLIEQHPDLANDLRSCLDGIDILGGGANLTSAVKDRIGDFVLADEIGRGGMGVVYRAHQVSLNRPVAIKILNLPLSDPKVCERFQREAAMAAGLHHTNIVPIYEVGSDDGTYFYAMQLIEGNSLADVLKDADEPLDLERVAQWGLQAADALAHAHDEGVIHRDIKPSNLIIDENERLWLTDFGLARRMDDVRLSATGAVVGTPRYMSPEQAATISAPVAEQTDIYSLGATLYELVCGKVAVPGDHPVAVINNIMNRECQSPRAFRPEVSRDFETILLKCLEKQPRDRYDTAAALASDLRALVEDRPIASRPISKVEHSRRWLKRNRRNMSWAAYGVMTAFLLLCAALWALWVYPTLDDAELSVLSLVAMRAEIQRLDGDSKPASIRVPATEPIKLDAGVWKSRLMRPGFFSHDVRLQLSRGEERTVVVPPPAKPLWDVDGVIRSQLVQFGNERGLILVTEDSIQRRNVSDGKIVWSVDQESLTMKINHTRHEPKWGAYPESVRFGYQPKPIVAVGENDDRDLNGDDVPDILLAGYGKAGVLALSGADGAVIWSRLYTKKEGVDSNRAIHCVWLDSEDSGASEAPSFCAVFAHRHSSFSPVHIARVDGTDGSIRWTHDQAIKTRTSDAEAIALNLTDRISKGSVHQWNGFDAGSTFVTSTNRHLYHGHGGLIPLTQRIAGDRMLCVTDDKIRVLDVVSGESHDALTTSAFPLHKPKRIRRKDGTTDLLVSTIVNPMTSHSAPGRCEYRALDESNLKTQWEYQSTYDPTAFNFNWNAATSLPLVADLDHDGADEIIVQKSHARITTTHFVKTKPWAEIQILDSAGQELLNKPIRFLTADLQLLHATVVSDCDGDGKDELAFATRYVARRENVCSIYIDVVSSESGQIIWQRKIDPPGFDARNSLVEVFDFDRKVINGSETLVLQTAVDPKFHAPTLMHVHLIDAATGNVLHIGDQLTVESIVQSPDHGDLLWCLDRSLESGEQTREKLGRRFMMFQAPREEILDLSSRVRLVGDLDGGGQLDLHVDPQGGTDGKETFISTESRLRVPGVQFNEKTSDLSTDFTGNGKGDSLVWGYGIPVRMREGSSGRTIWSLSDQIHINNYMLCTRSCSLRESDSKDVIIAAYANVGPEPSRQAHWNQSLMVFGVNGENGSILWRLDFGPPPSSAEMEDLHYEFGDITGDGRTDFVFCYGDESKVPTLFAVDGAKGETIWSVSDIYSGSPREWLGHYPKPAIVTHPESPAVAILSLERDSRQGRNTTYNLTVVEGSTGRELLSREFDADNDFISTHYREAHGKYSTIVQLRRSNGSARFAFVTKGEKDRYFVNVYDIGSDGIQQAFEPWQYDWKKGSKQRSISNLFTPAVIDADRDGNDDIVMFCPGDITAFQADGTQIWKRDLAGHKTLQPILRQMQGQNELMVQYFRTETAASTLGIDPANGSTLWVARGAEGWSFVESPDTADGLLNADSELPTFVVKDESRDLWSTIDAVPVDAGNREAQKVRVAASTADRFGTKDPRLLGTGPYPRPVRMYMGLPSNGDQGSDMIFWCLMWAGFVICVPAFLAYHVIRSRQLTLARMMIIMASVAACFALLTIPVGNRPVDVTDRLLGGIVLVPHVIWFAALFYFLRNGKNISFLILICGPLVLLGLSEAYKWIAEDTARIQVASDWFRIWRGLPVCVFLTMLIIGPVLLTRSGNLESSTNSKMSWISLFAIPVLLLFVAGLGIGFWLLVGILVTLFVFHVWITKGIQFSSTDS